MRFSRVLRMSLLTLRGFSAALGLTAVFGVSCLAGLVLHLNLPAGRRLTAAVLTDLLSDLFRGSLSVAELNHIGPRGIVASEITVRDPAGRLVLHVDKLTADADVIDIAQKILFGGNKISLVIDHVRIEHADGAIVPDEKTGIPTIGSAFAVDSDPSSTSSTSDTGRYVRVWLPVVEVGRAFARGRAIGLPTLEADLGAVRGSVLATPKGAAVDITDFSALVRGMGGADMHGVGTLHIRAPGAVWSSFNGYFGDLQVGSVLRVDGSKLNVTLDFPRARPDEVRALWPDYPLQKEASGHVELTGIPPFLDVDARLQVEGSALTARGELRAQANTEASLDIEGRAVDIRAVLPEAPATNIDLTTSLTLYSQNGQLIAELNGTTKPTQIGGLDIPTVDVSGTYSKVGFKGRAIVHERGMPLRVDVVITPDGVVDADAVARRFDLSKAERLRGVIKASGSAEVRVKSKLEKGRFTAQITGQAQDFAHANVRMATAKLSGNARGEFAHPEALRLDAKLSGTRLALGQFFFEEVDASARGPITRPAVTVSLRDKVGPSLDAKATVTTRGAFKADRIELEVRRDDAALRGNVAHLGISEGALDIEDLALVGAGGSLQGSAKIRPELVTIDAKGQDLDLEAVARILGLPRGTMGGKLRVDADVVAAKDVQRGSVSLSLTNGTIGVVNGVTLKASANLNGQTFEGDASAQVENIGAFGAVWNTELGGPPAKPQSWEDITGSARVQLQGLQLSHLSYLVPKNWHIEDVRGQGFGHINIERKDPEALPSIALVVGTQGLGVLGEETEDGKARLRVDGVEAGASGHFNGESGDTDLTIQLSDNIGAISSATANMRIDLPRARKQPDQLLAQLLNTEILGKLVVDGRKLEQLPAPFRPARTAGTLRAEANLRGTLTSPTLAANLKVASLRLGGNADVAPLDACVQAVYEKASGRFMGGAELHLPRPSGATCTGQYVGRVRGSGIADWDTFVGGSETAETTWTATADATLEGLPVNAVSALADAEMTGLAYGQMHFERPGPLPQLFADVTVRRTEIARIPIGDARMTLISAGKPVKVTLDVKHREGNLVAKAEAALRWDELAPGLDDTRPVRVDIQAKNVDAVLLSPILRDVLSELSGPIDAKLAAVFTPRLDAQEGPRFSGGVSGEVTMNDGALQFAGLGLRLNGVRFKALAENHGDSTQITIRDLKAMAHSRVHNLWAGAWLRMRGSDVEAGEATVNVQKVPLLLQGVSQATATGSGVHIKLTRHPKEMLVDVTIPRMEAELPRSSSRSLIEIAPNEAIEILQPISEPRKRGTGEMLPWRFVVGFGQRVKITRSDLILPITGRTNILLAEEAEITGEVELTPGGRFNALGKAFVIEGGSANFDTGDPSDPRIDGVASWRAPDGTVVYISVSGTLKNPKLRFRSDPDRPQDEIQALLLGGSSGEEGGDARSTGIGVGANLVSSLLSDAPIVSDIEFRTANEQSADQRSYSTYTGAYPLSDTLWVEGSYKQLQTADPNDAGSAFSITFDWRFKKNWSLRTEGGTIGAGLDLLWQYRY
jgi:hypothetical protein